LQRLPAPYDAHYGVVPVPPPEDSIALPAEILQRHVRAAEAMVSSRALATETKDSRRTSRILRRQEAVSSCAIEGVNSTLTELLFFEEAGEGEASDAALQVSHYAKALDDMRRENSEYQRLKAEQGNWP